MPEALLKLAREFLDKGAPETARSLPDALWLAQFLPAARTEEKEQPPPETATVQVSSSRKQRDEKPLQSVEAKTAWAIQGPTPPPFRIEPIIIDIPHLRPERLPIGMLVPKDHPHAIRSSGGPEFSIPAPPGLERPQEFGRRLKPLRNFRRNPHKHLLDVERTVERICDERIWELVTRHPYDRCLHLTWISDIGRGMTIWRQLGRELYLAFRDSGVFRDTRAYEWQVDETWQQSFMPLDAFGLPDSNATPTNRLPPVGRDSLVVFFSDCSSGRWYQPEILRQLHDLGEQAQVLVINPLPERMWGRTALGQVAEIDLRAPFPGAPAQRLQTCCSADRPISREGDSSLNLVAVAAEPEHLLGWCRFAAGRRAVYPGFSLASEVMGEKLAGARQSISQLTAEQRLQRFFRYASRAGRELARLLAAVPLITPRFIRLVRGRMLSSELKADHLHDAEVLLSPLLKLLGAAENTPESEPVYDFHDGVRELLLAQTPTARIQEVFRYFVDLEVRADLTRSGSLGEYRAMLLTGDDQNAPFAVHPLSKAPTELIMRYLGGEYRRLLDEMQSPSLLRRLNTWLQQAEEARVGGDVDAALDALRRAEALLSEHQDEWGEAGPLLSEQVQFYKGVLLLDPEVSKVLFAPELWKVPKSFVESCTGMMLLPIEPGTFLMGSPENEADRFDDEGPQHSVTLSRAFWLGKYPVTQAEYEKVIGNNPSQFKGERRPVEQVSWDEAVEFCRRLTEKAHSEGRLPAGYEFRLPTEAEWEYCCRAGSSSAYCFGGDEDRLADYAWYNKNSKSGTYEVGLKQANAWGLYDMHGNVREWCLDQVEGLTAYDRKEDVVDPLSASGQFRVLRGGSWLFTGRYCRSAYRFANEPAYRNSFLGFRVCLAPSPAENP